MSDAWYVLRDDAPDWARDAWPDDTATYWDDLGPVWAEDLPVELQPWCDAWQCVASFDYGIRTADELAAVVAATVADVIMRPVLLYIGPDPWRLDAWAALCEEYDYPGDGWCEPTDDDPHCERMSWLWEDVDRWVGDVAGMMVETSSDAGMTWVLVRDAQ